MQNPETGSGGMLVGTVEEVGPESPLGLTVGDRVATLVSLTLTPLVIEDGLARWDGRSEQVPSDGYAVLFGRSIAAVIPDDLPERAQPRRDGRLRRARADQADRGAVRQTQPGRSSPSSAAPASPARSAWRPPRTPAPGAPSASCRSSRRRSCSPTPRIADEVVIADARDPIALRDAVVAAGGPADVTVVCVDVPGCEGGAILATAERGTVIFFSMATSFSAAALGAEGLAADVTMLVGNGYVPGHAAYALELLRADAGVRGLFERRL